TRCGPLWGPRLMLRAIEPRPLCELTPTIEALAKALAWITHQARLPTRVPTRTRAPRAPGATRGDQGRAGSACGLGRPRALRASRASHLPRTRSLASPRR